MNQEQLNKLEEDLFLQQLTDFTTKQKDYKNWVTSKSNDTEELYQVLK